MNIVIDCWMAGFWLSNAQRAGNGIKGELWQSMGAGVLAFFFLWNSDWDIGISF